MRVQSSNGQRRLAECDGKHAFKSHADAARMARTMNHRGKRGKKVSAYRCTECHWFHVGGILKRPRRPRDYYEDEDAYV